MKKILFTLGLSFFLVSIFGQDLNSEIKVEKRKYYQNEERLSTKDLKAILSVSPEAEPEYDLWIKNSRIANPILFGSGACIFIGGALLFSSSLKQMNDLNNGQLPGNYMSGGGFIFTGLVLALASYPFAIPAGKHLRNAVNLHNSSLSFEQQRSINFDLLLTTREIGVRLKF